MSDNNKIFIDLTGRLEEGRMVPFLAQQGASIKATLSHMFTGVPFPLEIRGTRKQIDRFAQAIAAEKAYAFAFNKYGLNNPAIYRSKYKLDSAVKKFERDTGIVWPIK